MDEVAHGSLGVRIKGERIAVCNSQNQAVRRRARYKAELTM